MRKEVGVAELLGVIGETLLVDPIIGGLAVFKALTAGGVGEGEEQVVLVVVVILIERVGFTDEIRDFGEGGRAEIRIARLVRGYVDKVSGLDLGGERKLVESRGR